MQLLGTARLAIYYAAWICGCASVPISLGLCIYGHFWPLYCIFAYYSFRYISILSKIYPLHAFRYPFMLMYYIIDLSNPLPIGQLSRPLSIWTRVRIVIPRKSYLKKALLCRSPIVRCVHVYIYLLLLYAIYLSIYQSINLFLHAFIDTWSDLPSLCPSDNGGGRSSRHPNAGLELSGKPPFYTYLIHLSSVPLIQCLIAVERWVL